MLVTKADKLEYLDKYSKKAYSILNGRLDKLLLDNASVLQLVMCKFFNDIVSGFNGDISDKGVLPLKIPRYKISHDFDPSYDCSGILDKVGYYLSTSYVIDVLNTPIGYSEATYCSGCGLTYPTYLDRVFEETESYITQLSITNFCTFLKTKGFTDIDLADDDIAYDVVELITDVLTIDFDTLFDTDYVSKYSLKAYYDLGLPWVSKVNDSSYNLVSVEDWLSLFDISTD